MSSIRRVLIIKRNEELIEFSEKGKNNTIDM